MYTLLKFYVHHYFEKKKRKYKVTNTTLNGTNLASPPQYWRGWSFANILLSAHITSSKVSTAPSLLQSVSQSVSFFIWPHQSPAGNPLQATLRTYHSSTQLWYWTVTLLSESPARETLTLKLWSFPRTQNSHGLLRASRRRLPSLYLTVKNISSQ